MSSSSSSLSPRSPPSSSLSVRIMHRIVLAKHLHTRKPFCPGMSSFLFSSSGNDINQGILIQVMHLAAQVYPTLYTGEDRIASDQSAMLPYSKIVSPRTRGVPPVSGCITRYTHFCHRVIWPTGFPVGGTGRRPISHASVGVCVRGSRCILSASPSPSPSSS